LKSLSEGEPPGEEEFDIGKTGARNGRGSKERDKKGV